MVGKIKNKIKYFLIPSEENNYHPRLLQTISVCFYIFILIFVQSTSKILAKTNPQILGFATDISVETVFKLVNSERSKKNLSLLNYSQELSQAAYDKAIDMFNNDYWAHVSPTGVTPWQFIDNAGYNYIYAGENLAKDFDYSDDVFEAWMNSPTHRSNILKPEYTDIGIAVVNGNLLGRDTTLVIQEFGKKSDSEPSVKQSSIYQRKDTIFPTKTNLFSDRNTSSPSAFNFRLSRTTSLIMAELLLVALFIDSIYMWRRKVIRLTGKSVAHFIFIGVIIAAIGFTGAGVIL